MTEQQLNRPQVLRAAVDQRCLGAPERVGAVLSGIQPDQRDPTVHDPRVLSGGEMAGRVDTAGKEKIRGGQLPLDDVVVTDRFPA